MKLFGKSDVSALMATLTFTLWAFLGVESASVSADVVENPKRNVPIATIGRVVLASVAYVPSSSVIMGTIPNAELVVSSVPFADAARLALGDVVGGNWSQCGCGVGAQMNAWAANKDILAQYEVIESAQRRPASDFSEV